MSRHFRQRWSPSRRGCSSPSPSRGGPGWGWCSSHADAPFNTIPTQTLPLKGKALLTSSWGPRKNAGIAAIRLLKWFGIAVLALVLITSIVLYWLLETESGARFALARAVAAMEGKLAFERSSGYLAGPLTLINVRYNDPAAGVDAHVGSVIVDVAPAAFLSKRVHIVDLEVEGVDVALTTVPPKPEEPASEFSLVAPVDVLLDRFALKKATFSQDGQPLFAADSLDLAGAWTRGGALIKALSLRAPEGSVDLRGTLSSAPGYPGDGETTFHWKAADREIAGTLKAKGDGRQATLDLALNAPTPATITATLTQSRDFPWTAKITVPRFDPKIVQPDSTLAALEEMVLTGDEANLAERVVDLIAAPGADATKVVLDE